MNSNPRKHQLPLAQMMQLGNHQEFVEVQWHFLSKQLYNCLSVYPQGSVNGIKTNYMDSLYKLQIINYKWSAQFNFNS